MNRGTLWGSSSSSLSMPLTLGSAFYSSLTRSITCTLTRSETATKVSVSRNASATSDYTRMYLPRAETFGIWHSHHRSAGGFCLLTPRWKKGWEIYCAMIPKWQMAFAVSPLERLPSLFLCLHGLLGLQQSGNLFPSNCMKTSQCWQRLLKSIWLVSISMVKLFLNLPALKCVCGTRFPRRTPCRI